MKNLERNIAFFAIVIILIYTMFNYYNKSKHIDKRSVNSIKIINKESNKSLSEIEYIINVINNGSNHLGFKGGEMEGGYIPKEKAKDVACYLMSLRRKPCKDGYSQDAPLYFSSNCAGCHGVDAKGIKGSYPNLLREPLLGLEK